MWYHPDDDLNADSDLQLHFYGDDGTTDPVQLTDSAATNGDHINPFYMMWCGQSDGSGNMTNNDMQSSISGYDGANISKVEFDFQYAFASAYRIGNDQYLSATKHPYFEVKIGKQVGTDIFGAVGATPTDAHKRDLVKGKPAVCGIANAEWATFTVGEDEVWNGPEDEEHNVPWVNSYNWPYEEVYGGGSGGRQVYGDKQFTGTVTFNDDNPIAITDDMIMEFKVIYPEKGSGSTYTLFDCMRFKEDDGNSDWDFARWEYIYFTGIRVYFEDTNWSASIDGVTADNINDTKVNYNFASPGSEEAAVGWSDRIFKVGVTSVNIFGEESHICLLYTSDAADE